MPGDGGRPNGGFVAAGSGEARDGSGSYAERIVRYGDQSPEAMRDKAHLVLDVMQERMAPLGKSWSDVTATQVYTVFDIHSYLADEFVRRGATAGGLILHFARPPVHGLDVDGDVRCVSRELVI